MWPFIFSRVITVVLAIRMPHPKHCILHGPVCHQILGSKCFWGLLGYSLATGARIRWQRRCLHLRKLVFLPNIGRCKSTDGSWNCQVCLGCYPEIAPNNKLTARSIG
ncbi:hypothetical protein EDB80DRAFT_428316 [Ilyonectria destructans]|nr:hypothetical protein EDB80DRAFT_428316 [Ilyonectria destructans]